MAPLSPSGDDFNVEITNTTTQTSAVYYLDHEVGGTAGCLLAAHVGENVDGSPDVNRISLLGNTLYRLRFWRNSEPTLTWDFLYALCRTPRPVPPGFPQVDPPPQPGSLTCPYGISGGTPDMNIYFDDATGMRVRPLRVFGAISGTSGGVQDYLNDDMWAMPFNAWNVCDQIQNCSLSMSTVVDVPFITPHSSFPISVSHLTDIEVPLGITWTLDDEYLDAFKFASSEHLRVRGALLADGVSFGAADSGQPWGGILVDGGVVTLSGGVIEYAATGLDVRSMGNTVTGTTIRYGGAGIRTYPTKTGNSSLTLTGVSVTGNTGNGVYAAGTNLRMFESSVASNGGTGLVVTAGVVEEFTNNTVTGNGILGGSGSDGYAVAVGAQGTMRLSPLDAQGLNRLANSATTELWVSEGATSVFAGNSALNGHNTIEDAAGILVRVPWGFTIPAMYHYWGSRTASIRAASSAAARLRPVPGSTATRFRRRAPLVPLSAFRSRAVLPRSVMGMGSRPYASRSTATGSCCARPPRPRWQPHWCTGFWASS
jgi:hypothetical protein